MNRFSRIANSIEKKCPPPSREKRLATVLLWMFWGTFRSFESSLKQGDDWRRPCLNVLWKNKIYRLNTRTRVIYDRRLSTCQPALYGDSLVSMFRPSGRLVESARHGENGTCNGVPSDEKNLFRTLQRPTPCRVCVAEGSGTECTGRFFNVVTRRLRFAEFIPLVQVAFSDRSRVEVDGITGFRLKPPKYPWTFFIARDERFFFHRHRQSDEHF